ncbi:MAG: hypothetical protein QJR09_10215 [Micrococcus sp.]|nr:hypothetical protein [Micrococcus sp.]
MDVARGVALIGIVVVNVLPELGPTGKPLLAWTLLAVAVVYAVAGPVAMQLVHATRPGLPQIDTD